MTKLKISNLQATLFSPTVAECEAPEDGSVIGGRTRRLLLYNVATSHV